MGLHRSVVKLAIRFLSLSILTVSSLQLADTQPQLSIPLKIVYGSTDSITLHFGYDCRATRCVDTLLGERYLPPLPLTGNFDARFADPRGYDPDCLDQGVVAEILPWNPLCFTDTFLITLQKSSEVADYHLSWPPALGAYFLSCNLMDQFGGVLVNVNMLTDTQTVAIGALSALNFYAVTTCNDECPQAVKSIGIGVPARYKLYPNTPNPFNPSTVIRYDLPRTSFVNVTIYDVLGREVAAPVANVLQSPGTYRLTFDGSQLSNGVYFCRMIAGSYIKTQKMIAAK